MGLVLLAAGLGAFSSPAGAMTKVADLTYDAGAPGPATELNRVDLYLPDGAAPGDLRPVVIYVHGGAWMIGDKSRVGDKAKLFTDAGYVFASVNYRLSPDISEGPVPPAIQPGRIRFPAHPQDVGEAVAWIARNVTGYGGDPDALLLTGHSSGAHLVSLVGSDPSYLEDAGSSLKQVIGVVSLDAGAMDVVDSAAQRGANPSANNYVIWNAFGTPAEEAADPRWAKASPVTWGDPGDPRSLMVTQASRPPRILDNEKMAAALGQDPSTVLKVPLDHEGINAELGSPNDSTGETAAVMAFVADRIANRPNPVLKIRRRPAKLVKVGRRQKKRKVVFAFTAENAARVECRLGGTPFAPCGSPRTYVVKRGKHRFRVRALYPSGRTGAEKTVDFRVKPKRVKRGRNG